MKTAPRLVSLAPSNTEIVAALGLMEQLVGVDDWSDWPPAVDRLPRVGPDLSVDLDRVAALKPDLVLASLSVPGMEKNIAGLKDRGIPHITLDPHGLAEIWANIQLVGDACGVAERAAAVVGALQARVERVRAAARGGAGSSTGLRLYWEWWPKPIYTPGRRNWLTEITEVVGCTNIFADYDVDNVRVDDGLEVVRRAPDYVLLAWTGAKRPDPAHVYRRAGWGDLEALRAGRVHAMEEGLFNRPSPRLVDGLERLWELVGGAGT
jgi:iron complex transport system substrate-binding protein